MYILRFKFQDVRFEIRLALRASASKSNPSAQQSLRLQVQASVARQAFSGVQASETKTD